GRHGVARWQATRVLRADTYLCDGSSLRQASPDQQRVDSRVSAALVSGWPMAGVCHLDLAKRRSSLEDSGRRPRLTATPDATGGLLSRSGMVARWQAHRRVASTAPGAGGGDRHVRLRLRYRRAD